MSLEAVCWCCTDSKCPHPISAKLSSVWDEIEAEIDKILIEFDRKALRAYLKHDVDGNSKEKLSETIKRSLHNNESNNIIANIHRKKTALGRDGIHFTQEIISNDKTKFMEIGPRPSTTNDIRTSTSPGRRSKQGSGKVGYVHTAVIEDKQGYAHNKVKKSESTPSLPVISTNAAATTTSEIPFKIDMEMIGPNNDASEDRLPRLNNDDKSVYTGIPGDAAVSVGLQRIADNVSRKVLPWSAVQCPRAVENIRDSRQNGVHVKHVEFLGKMAEQLENKVLDFIEKKEVEIDLWLERELSLWRDAMSNQETSQTLFFRNDKARNNIRVNIQDQAKAQRELWMAANLDERERDAVREQLANFRRICQNETALTQDSRILNASIESAHNKATAQTSVNMRDVLRKIEESHEWLCCLADNAITASISEENVQDLFYGLDKERERAITSLHTALNSYTEQHNAILDAITVFAGKIHQHSSDYLRREQLVSRAFLQYVLGIINGEIKSHTTDQRRSAVSWEAKFATERSTKRDIAFFNKYESSMQPFDKLVVELRGRMSIQLELFKTKMQSALNGKDNDINRRKAVIHKKFSKYVSKACNSRRLRLKSNSITRKDMYELEGHAITAIADVCSEIRVEIDKLWIRNNTREKRMKDAANGRLSRLDKSAMIIWNKHSHLAVNVQKEQYEEWITMYRKDRDALSYTRLQEILSRFNAWRVSYYPSVYKFISSIRQVRPHYSPTYSYLLILTHSYSLILTHTHSYLLILNSLLLILTLTHSQINSQ